MGRQSCSTWGPHVTTGFCKREAGRCELERWKDSVLLILKLGKGAVS